MPSIAFEYATESERAAIERAAAFVAEMRRLAQSAPDGQAVHACEGLALGPGRGLPRGALRSAVQGRVDAAERKGGPPGPAPAAPRGRRG